MSPVGKLFVILNLVLAAVFVGSAASLIGTSGQYKQQADQLQTEMTDMQQLMDASVADLETQLDAKDNELQRKLNEVRDLEAGKAAVEGELETERQQNADLRESITGIESKLGDLEQTNRAATNRVGELVRENGALRDGRDQALQAQATAHSAKVSAEQQAQIATSTAENLQRQIDGYKNEADRAKAQLATAARLFKIDLSRLGTAQPELNGVVLDASYSGGAPVVIVNLGRKDGVEPGFSFDVFQGATYKGRVRVEVVNENNSACTIEMPGNAQIQRNDRVATSV